MWIYYYATFGPGSQSSDYGFRHFHDSYGNDSREMIKEYLFNTIDSCGYSINLTFWEVERPPADYVNGKMEDAKEKIKDLKKYLKTLESVSCFVSEEVEGEDPVLMKNLGSCHRDDLLRRLHKAGFMYGEEDVSNWRYGKKHLCEPSRSKILSIVRRTKKYPPIKEQLAKQRKR
jgi:hypothetical protein